MKTLTSVAFLSLIIAAAHGSADAPYNGTWKLNAAKSDFGERTVEFSEEVNGSVTVTRAGQSYIVRTDGKDYPTPWGETESWRPLGGDKWEVTLKRGATVTSRFIRELSADGKTLTLHVTRIDANGDTAKEEITYQRISGRESDISGKWKLTGMSMQSPRSISISEDGSGAVTLKNINDNVTCIAKTEGRDYPAQGGLWPEGWTCAVTRTDPMGLKITWKKDGDVMIEEAISASNDGKSLTSVMSTPGTKEKLKAIFDRQ